jgi:hypothetical protein
MTVYQITKYNPENRNAKGHYLDNSEWTSISDIGKPEYNKTSFKEYQETESAYINAIKLILSEKNINSLKVDSLEGYNTKKNFDKFNKDGLLRGLEIDFEKDIKPLANNLNLDQNQIYKLARLILRESIWMLLKSSEIEIKFGYDYYMIITCKSLSKETIALIEESGLYVE